MSQRNETLPLIVALICTGAILAGGYWWFQKKSTSKITPTPTATDRERNPTPTVNHVPNLSQNPVTFSYPTNVPQGTAISINGSTSMVQINQAIKKGFERQINHDWIEIGGLFMQDLVYKKLQLRVK